MCTESPNNTVYRGKDVRTNSPKYEKWDSWRKDHRTKRSKDWREKISQGIHKHHLKKRKQQIINHDI